MRMHLHYFTRKSLAVMVRQAGFEVLRLTTQLKTLKLGYVLRRARSLLGPVGDGAHTLVGWLGQLDRSVCIDLGDILLIQARKPE